MTSLVFSPEQKPSRVVLIFHLKLKFITLFLYLRHLKTFFKWFSWIYKINQKLERLFGLESSKVCNYSELCKFEPTEYCSFCSLAQLISCIRILRFQPYNPLCPSIDINHCWPLQPSNKCWMGRQNIDELLEEDFPVFLRFHQIAFPHPRVLFAKWIKLH